MSNLHNLATRTNDVIKVTLDGGAHTATITCNAIKGQVVRTTIVSAASSTAFTSANMTVSNNRVGPDSVIILNVSSVTGGGGLGVQIQTITVTSGQFVLGIAPNTTTAITAITFDFYVLNPVCSR